jgi:hypothetical protein
MAGLVLTLAVGCVKKNVKNTTPSKDESASAKPQPPAPKSDKKAEEPNWLTDPRFKKEKDEPNSPKDAGPNGKPPPIVPAPNLPASPGQGVLQPQPQQPAPQPANPPAAPAAKFDPVSEHDMKDVWIFIENYSQANSGKMPPPALTFQALVTAKSPAAELVKNGSIILTGSDKRESIWAFEARGAFQGGFIANQNGVETATAAQIKAALGK